MKRKVISVLFALVLVLSFSLVTAVPNMVCASPEKTLYVDDDALVTDNVSAYDSGSCNVTATSAVFTSPYGVGDAVEFISGTADGMVAKITNIAADNLTATLDTEVGAAVSDDFNLVALNPPSAIYAFRYIQSAITIAASNDTINVAAGQYTEDLTVATANITLKSASSRDNTTIQLVDGIGIDIQGTANNFILGGAASQGFTIVGNSANTTINIQTDNTTGVQISSNTINTVGSATKGIFVEGTVGATGLTVSQNNFIADTNDVAINGSKLVSVTVSGNIFPDPSSSSNISAMEFTGITATSTISQNTITGYDGGIVIVSGGGGTSNLTISGNNPISGCAKGIWFKQDVAGDITTVTATQNVLTSNDIGIQIDLGANVLANQFTINNNNITGSTTWGLQNQNSLAVTAEDNWWGDATGPKQATTNPSATGDEVSANVTYTPWLNAVGGSPRSFNVLNTDTEEEFNWIQAAISAASNGDALSAFAGTYSENITIDESLKLFSAAGSGNTKISANTTGFAVDITTDNVTLGSVGHGFTITNSDTSGSGIKLGGSSCRIDSNKIDNNYNGIQIAGSENHVRRNTITGNSNYGIYFDSDTIGEGWNEVHYNDITGNGYGAFATPKTGESHWMQWAGFNYWGDVTGPGGAGPSAANNAVNEYVWYNPWLNSSFSTILDEGIADISMGIPLEVGWNTLSTPLPLNGTDSLYWDNIVDNSSLPIGYLATTYSGGSWTFPTATTELNPLDAMFIKIPAGKSGIVVLKVSTATNPPPTKSLTAGWNLIGASMQITARELEMWQVLQSVHSNQSGEVGYNMVVSPPMATQPSWVYVRGQEDIGTYDWEEMWMGRGYWIYMENDDELAGFGSTPLAAKVWD